MSDAWASWPLGVACLVALPELISLFALLLQRSRIGNPVPPELADLYDREEYATSNAYTKAKGDVALLKDIFDLAVFFAFWFLKGFAWLDCLCMGLGFGGQITTGLLFLGAIGLASLLLDTPWDIYRTFVLEERFGFNKTTPWTFVKDRLKAVALGTALGAPLMAVVLWFFIRSGTSGWLWVFLTITVFQLSLIFIMPVAILPLFLEMIPLPSGTALITHEAESMPRFLAGRTFYSLDGCQGDSACWVTRDRRFAGAKAGAALHVRRTQAGDAGAHPCARWLLQEGEPSSVGPVYAMCSEDMPGMACTSTAGTASNAAGGTLWLLTEAAAAARAAEGAREPAQGVGTVSGAEPLMPGSTLSEVGLRMTCVEVGSLRERLLLLATRLGYHGASIFVIDGSSRSSHSNAFCTGFGRFRRICLFDTLLPAMSEGEIVAVLGHEIGHDRLYHVHSHLALSLVYSFVMLYSLGQFLVSPMISSAFFVPVPKVYTGVVLFSIVWSVVDFVVSIPLTVQSRMNEFAADRFSIDADMTHANLLSSALKKLNRKSKANLTPHPFYAFLTYSHPPLDVRLQAMKDYHQQRYGQAPGA